LPSPDSIASATICQNCVASPISAIASVISSVPPIRKRRAP
jgi:hypothetical protein